MAQTAQIRISMQNKAQIWTDHKNNKILKKMLRKNKISKTSQ